MMKSCLNEHGVRNVVKYLKQTPKENVEMFEAMDKEEKHGTLFYPLLYHERDLEKTRK
jgi:hypothetical protein